MQDRPTAVELLRDIAELLEGEVLPALHGPLQHQVRVAGNLCRIIERELELGPESERREVGLLAELLGADEGDPLALNRQLVERLRAHDDVAFEKRTWAALVEIVKGKLAVAKPGHDSHDFAGETGA